MKVTSLPATLILATGLAAFATGLSGDIARDIARDIVTGTVREGSGSPVSSARVELMDGTRLLQSVWTSRDGSFRISTPASWTAAWRIRVDRLGFGAVDVPVPASLTVGDLLLSPAPLPIPGLQVEADRDICSAREDPAARRLWEATARLHAGGLDTLGIATYSEERTDTLAGDPRAIAGEIASILGQRTSASLLRLSWTRRVEREGYAFPVRRSDRERSYDSWSYPPLEAHFAPHFVEEAFGELHEFHNEGSAGDAAVLTFCGTRTNRPYLEGTLEIGPDTMIRRIEWRFVTPDPDEAAGGWARFDPAGELGGPFLLPRESLTWRTLPDGGVIRRAEWYEGWITAPGDSVPFLPAQAGSMPSPAPLRDPAPPSGSGSRPEPAP